MTKLNKIGMATVVIGFLLLISIFILPASFLHTILGNLRWGGLVTVFINPLLGIIGFVALLVQYFRSKRLQKMLLCLNICLIFSFPIMMMIASLRLS